MPIVVSVSVCELIFHVNVKIVKYNNIIILEENSCLFSFYSCICSYSSLCLSLSVQKNLPCSFMRSYLSIRLSPLSRDWSSWEPFSWVSFTSFLPLLPHSHLHTSTQMTTTKGSSYDSKLKKQNHKSRENILLFIDVACLR